MTFSEQLTEKQLETSAGLKPMPPPPAPSAAAAKAATPTTAAASTTCGADGYGCRTDRSRAGADATRGCRPRRTDTDNRAGAAAIGGGPGRPSRRRRAAQSSTRRAGFDGSCGDCAAGDGHRSGPDLRRSWRDAQGTTGTAIDASHDAAGVANVLGTLPMVPHAGLRRAPDLRSPCAPRAASCEPC